MFFHITSFKYHSMLSKGSTANLIANLIAKNMIPNLILQETEDDRA